MQLFSKWIHAYRATFFRVLPLSLLEVFRGSELITVKPLSTRQWNSPEEDEASSLEGRTERWKKPKGNKTGEGMMVRKGEKNHDHGEIKITHAHANQT